HYIFYAAPTTDIVTLSLHDALPIFLSVSFGESIPCGKNTKKIPRVRDFKKWRRKRDSNPRTCYSQQFSRLPQSTTLPFLQKNRCSVFSGANIKLFGDNAKYFRGIFVKAGRGNLSAVCNLAKTERGTFDA